MVIAGELLSKAEDLLRMGLHPSEVVEGYELALEKLYTVLDDIVVASVQDFHSRDNLMLAVRPAISSKQVSHVLVPVTHAYPASHIAWVRGADRWIRGGCGLVRDAKESQQL